MAQQQTSAVGVNVFRELDGNEYALVVAHDIEQGFINMLATDELKEKILEWLVKTGRFGTGACYPVVMMGGTLHFKVYASVESARSKEKMPAPFTLVMPEIVVGEMKTEIPHKTDCPQYPDPSKGVGAPRPGEMGYPECTCDARSATELVTEADVTVQRVIGLSVENAVDRVRLETNQTPLVPTRLESGAIANAPGKHAERAEDYKARQQRRAETLARAKANVAARRAQREAEAMGQEKRDRAAKENEARQHDA